MLKADAITVQAEAPRRLSQLPHQETLGGSEERHVSRIQGMGRRDMSCMCEHRAQKRSFVENYQKFDLSRIIWRHEFDHCHALCSAC